MSNVVTDRNGNVLIDYDKLYAIMNRKSSPFKNYKRALISILDNGEVALKRLNDFSRGVERDFNMELITARGREEKLNKLSKETGQTIETLGEEAKLIIDEALENLQSSWIEKAVESYEDDKLIKIVSMINNGAIPTEEELAALIDPYRENPKALEIIRKALDKNGAELSIQFLNETPKERTLRLIGQMRRNFSEQWHEGAIADLPLTIQGTRDFLETVADDLTVRS